MNYNYYFDDSLSLHNVTCTHKQYSRRRKKMQDSLDTESGYKIAKNYPYNMQVYSTILIKSKQSKGNKKMHLLGTNSILCKVSVMIALIVVLVLLAFSSKNGPDSCKYDDHYNSFDKCIDLLK